MFMQFYKDWKQYISVLTNGETELEITCSRYYCHVDPGRHIYGQDGLGNMYIDGKPAHVEIRERECYD